MELNWSTFLLEIVNFLVLVWILKRFFYKPVLGAIARRKASVERTLEEANSLHQKAESLQHQYQDRLVIWERERQTALRHLDKEIEEERARQMEAMRGALEKEREKARVIERQQRETERRQIEQTALLQSAQFAARLLSIAAGPELERSLLDLLTKQLAESPAEQLDRLRALEGKGPERILVTSAYPLGGAERTELEQTLGAALGTRGPYHYSQDPALLAGLRINIGPWVLAANLQDELRSFTNFAHEA